MYHGAKSSYRHFADYLQKNNGNRLEKTLENYLIADNLWGDFEVNLANLDREKLMESVGVMLDTVPETLDNYDDNFRYADYCASIEIACEPIL